MPDLLEKDYSGDKPHEESCKRYIALNEQTPPSVNHYARITTENPLSAVLKVYRCTWPAMAVGPYIALSRVLIHRILLAFEIMQKA